MFDPALRFTFSSEDLAVFCSFWYSTHSRTAFTSSLPSKVLAPELVVQNVLYQTTEGFLRHSQYFIA